MKISISLFGKWCSRTSSGRHALTKKDRTLWGFFPGPQRTNLSLQTGLRSNRGSVPEKLVHKLQTPVTGEKGAALQTISQDIIV